MQKKDDKLGNKTALKKGKEKKRARKNIKIDNYIQLAENHV